MSPHHSRSNLSAIDDIAALHAQINRLTARVEAQDATIHLFSSTIQLLLEVRDILLQAREVPELLRMAVDLGHRRLGFERLSVWLCTDEPNAMTGTFGIDEHGSLRDEHDAQVRVHPSSMMGRILAEETRLLVQADDALFNEHAEIIGYGSHAVAALWDGQRVIGCLSTDTYLSGHPFSSLQLELIGLYSAMIGLFITELRLKASQLDLTHQLRLLLDNTPHPVFVRADDGRVILGNRALAEIYGLKVDDVIGKTQEELYGFIGLPKEFADSALAEDHAVLDSGLPSVRVKAFTAADGQPRWFRTLRCRVALRDGTPCVLVLSEEITEKKQVDDALKTSESRYRRIVETAQEGICTLDAIGYVTYLNPQMASMLGYSVDELLGRSALDFIDAKTGTEMMEFTLRRQEGFDGTRDIRIWRKDGRDVWVNVSLTPIIDIDGKQRGMLIMVTDVTKRKEAENALQRDRAFLTAGAGIVPIPIFVLSAEGKITWQNQAMTNFLTRQRIVLMQSLTLADAATRELIPPAEWPSARALYGETVMAFPCRLVLPDGTEVPIRESAVPVTQEGNVVDVLVMMQETDG